MGDNRKESDIEIDVDIATRWWSDYPLSSSMKSMKDHLKSLSKQVEILGYMSRDKSQWPGDPTYRHYNRLTRAQDMHREFVTDSFHKPKKLARSLSADRFAGVREMQFDFPIKRSPSVSEFSPSHQQPTADRQAHRYIDMSTYRLGIKIKDALAAYRAYEPRSYVPYYHQTYAPWQARQLLYDVSHPRRRPEHNPVNVPIVHSSYHPEMKLRTQSAFYNKLYRPESYMQVAAAKMNSFVGSRIRSIGYSLPFIYTTFDQVRAQNQTLHHPSVQGPTYYAPFDRHIRSSNVFYSRLSHPPTLRRTLYRSVAPKYAYKPLNGINRSRLY